MDRNLRLYTPYQALRSMLFWMPVFFLYFASVVTLPEVLLLESIYYLGVVVLEVPSGYFSDWLGRRLTLVISMVCWGGACVIFAALPTFEWFIAAQLMLAAGMAFNSGTDTSLLFESLAVEGRGGEMAEREGRALAVGFLAGAGSALAGGAAAWIDLRLAYLLSAVAGLAGLIVASCFREPPRREKAHAPHRQVAACVARLGDGPLLWIFAFSIGMTVLNHVPWEFTQPYLGFFLDDLTPVVSGALMAAIMVLGYVASGRAARIGRALGAPVTLLGTMLLQTGIIASLMLLHPAIVALLLLRGVPRAVMTPVMNAAIHPRVPDSIRATFLSIQSLAGRLAFAAALFAASLAVEGDSVLTHEVLSGLCLAFAAGGAGMLLLLGATAYRVRRL